MTLAALTDDGGGATDTLSGALSTSTVSVARETVPPAITGVGVPADGFYKQGDYLVFTVTMSEDVIVTGSPSIDITIGSTVRKLVYSPADSTPGFSPNDTTPGATPATLVFKYLLVTGDVDNDGVVLGSQIDLNGGSITDRAENSGSLLLGGTPPTTGIKVNLPPVGVDDTGTAVEAGGIANASVGSAATGNLLVNDTDNENDPLVVTAIRTGAAEGSGTAGVLGQPLAGAHGWLTVDAAGSFTYVVDDTKAAVEALRPGTSLTDSFNYTLTDGSSVDVARLVITIEGGNDAPTDIALTALSVAENQPAGTTIGTFSTTDVDAGDLFSYELVDGPGDTDNAAFQIFNTRPFPGGVRRFDLQTAAVFDFEAKSSYSIRVRSTDLGGLSTEKQFTITVTNVAESCTLVTAATGNVYVHGTAWSTSFRNHLAATSQGHAALGYLIPMGPADVTGDRRLSTQVNLVPWWNVNQIRITFSEDVGSAFDPSRVAITGINTASYTNGSWAYGQVGGVWTATWTMTSGFFAADKLLVSVSCPSENGIGGQALFQLNMLPGDVNSDAFVTAFDTSLVRQAIITNTVARGTEPANYTIFKDINGDGFVTAFDSSLPRSRVGTQLPAGTPPPPPPRDPLLDPVPPQRQRNRRKHDPRRSQTACLRRVCCPARIRRR